MKNSLAIPMKHRASSQKITGFPSTLKGIFQLNEDCLVEMFRYLPLKDVFKLLQTDERFRSAAIVRFSHGGVNLIDTSFRKDIPRHILEDFYKAYGPRASQMTFSSMYWPEFFDTIRHFQNLKGLALCEIYGLFMDKDLEKIELPGALEVLDISRCIIDEQILQNWFVQINATLTELGISEHNKWKPESYNFLKELTNLTRLQIRGDLPAEPLAGLLEQNKKNLRSFDLYISDGDKYYKCVPLDVWRSLTSLQRLTELKLHYCEVNDILPRTSNLWPELTSLTLQMRDPSAVLTQLGCQLSLTELCLSKMTDKIVLDFGTLRSFPNLRTLVLDSFDCCKASNNFSGIGDLEQVHCLVLNDGWFANYRTVMNIVASMPNLRNLKLYTPSFDDEDVAQKEDYPKAFEKLKMNLKATLDKLEPRNPPLQIEVYELYR